MKQMVSIPTTPSVQICFFVQTNAKPPRMPINAHWICAATSPSALIFNEG